MASTLPESLTGKKIGVLGAGREGAATAQWLLGQGADVTVADRSSKEELGETYQDLSKAGVVDWRLGAEYLEDLDDFDIVFRTPFLPANDSALEAARHAGVTVTSHTKLFMELCPAQVIGITGTKGKGTTAGLVYAMLEKAGRKSFLGGNIGKPPLEFLDEVTEDSIVVLELSSFQLEDLDRSPHVAVVTNLTSDHLDRHGSVEEYQAAKRSLVAHQTSDDLTILNADDAGATAMEEFATGQIQWFSTKKSVSIGATIKKGTVRVDVPDLKADVCTVDEIPVPGTHNQANVLAACLAATACEVTPDQMKQAIITYRGLPYHLEFIREKDGVRFFNDSYAANPTATIPAVESFTDPLVLIVGGLDRGLDFDGLAGRILDSPTRELFLLGDAGQRLGKTITVLAKEREVAEPELHTIERKEDLAAELAKVITSGDVVLFSPAAPSFDWFNNYTERGAFFTDLVNAL